MALSAQSCLSFRRLRHLHHPHGHAKNIEQAGKQAHGSKGRQGQRRAKAFRQAAGHQRAQRLDAHEQGGVDGHDTAAQMVGHATLHNGVR